MNAQALFSALYLSIVATAGLTLGIPTAWKWAAITAALAFFVEELRALERHWMQYDVRVDGTRFGPRPTDRSEWAGRIAFFLALASWATGTYAGVSLL